MQGFVFQKKPDKVEEVDTDEPLNLTDTKSEKLPTGNNEDITIPKFPLTSETGSLIGTVKLSKDHQPIQERALLAFKAFQEAVTNLETVTRRIEELTKATGERLNNGN